VIFDRIISTTFQHKSNFSPLIPIHLVVDEQYKLLLLTPVVFLDLGVQVVVPALSTLFTDTTW
jgi:hypothetical protein